MLDRKCDPLLDFFGTSVALEGDTAVVGADYGNQAQGAAYALTRQQSGALVLLDLATQTVTLPTPVKGIFFVLFELAAKVAVTIACSL